MIPGVANQSDGPGGPSAAAAPSDQTPAGPAPQSPAPPAGYERAGYPQPGPPRTPPQPPPVGGTSGGAGAGPQKPSVVSEFVSRLFGRTASQDQTPDGDRGPEQPAGGQTDQRTEALSPQA